jgi:large subunit ribosomal protein L25
MNEITVEVQEREDLGKNPSRRLRREGLVPAILYGAGKAPVPLTVDPRRLEEVLRGDRGINTLFHLHLPGKDLRRMVRIREYQRHPVTDRITHADFVRVEMDRKIQVNVPVRLEGTPEGVKNEGGILDFVQRTIEVECLPAAIPDGLVVDVSGLHVGQNVTVEDLADVAGDVRILVPGSTVVATVSVSRAAIAEEEAAAAAEAEAAEAAEAAEGVEGEAPAEGEAGKESEGSEK